MLAASASVRRGAVQILRPCAPPRAAIVTTMAEANTIRCYEYVNQPFAVVRAAILDDPEGLFRRATQAAVARAHTVAASLRVDVAGLQVGTDIDIEIDPIEEGQLRPGAPYLKIPLRWRAHARPGLFPTMQAELSLYALSPEETQIDLLGHYQPPLGVLGAAFDAIVGHRIAEASVHRLVDDIAARLVLDLAAQ